MIHDSVEYLVRLGRIVLVELELEIADPEYAIACCESAIDAGDSCLVMCDKNGGTMPWEVQKTARILVQHFEPYCIIGIHAHNDCGCVVSNSVSACHTGVGLVQVPE
jgi:2-isopropylmalate synthase